MRSWKEPEQLFKYEYDLFFSFYSFYAIIYSVNAIFLFAELTGGPVYKIIFYEDDDGRSDVLEWVRDLNKRAEKGDKNSRILLE